MIAYRILSGVVAIKELASRIWARDWGAVQARLGRAKPPDRRPRIWIHAASNGEVMSIKAVIDRLIQDGKSVLLTVNTDSALALAHNWHGAQISVCLAPIDLPGATQRVFDAWCVSAHITVESDLWPQRILSCPGPVLVLGARLTERSAKGWRRLNDVATRVMNKVDYLSAQDTASLDRFTSFGLSHSAKGPVFDLKALYTPTDETPDTVLTAAFDHARTWLAASTHEGEEDIVLSAHKAVLEDDPAVKLILAPRHPKRADAVMRQVNEHGLTVARRSLNEDPSQAQVYLADTMGEMHLWYTLAGITFVAGSLTDRGGHTPYEPAYFASAILHGPNTANFKAAYARLSEANAATCITDAASLTDALKSRADPQKQAALGEAAQSALKQDTDFDALMRDVIAVLDA